MDVGDLDLQMDDKIYKTYESLYNFVLFRFNSILNGLKDHKTRPNKINRF